MGVKDFKWRPAYAYVPGQTPRHDEDVFEPLIEPISELSFDAFSDSLTFHYAFIFLKEGYFWESHELLEAMWITCPMNSKERLFFQALVQIANMHLKRKMGREKAVMRLEDMAKELWDQAFQDDGARIYGFHASDLDTILHNIA